jgi:hypothetical protein
MTEQGHLQQDLTNGLAQDAILQLHMAASFQHDQMALLLLLLRR